MNADGSYSYSVDTANPAVNGLQAGDPALNDVFTYRVTDSDGDAVTATLTIAISGLNDAPVADDETNTVTEDVTLTVNAASGLLAGDTDADGDTLAVTTFTVAGDLTVYNAGDTATIAGKGDLTINPDGSYSFDPAPNYAGSVPVATYTVSDGTTTDTGTLTLTVDAVPDAPAITGLNDNGGGTDGSVEESDLASGSTPSGTSEVTSGCFTVTLRWPHLAQRWRHGDHAGAARGLRDHSGQHRNHARHAGHQRLQQRHRRRQLHLHADLGGRSFRRRGQ